MTLFSFCAFSLRRFRGLNSSIIEGLSPAGTGFLSPKKSLGLGARDVGLTFELGLELEVGLDNPGSWKTFAVGFGLNSCAFTLSLMEAAEVGVRTVLDACELGTGAALNEGRLGGF